MTSRRLKCTQKYYTIYALYNTVPFFRLNIKPTSKAKCITYHLKGLLKINREEAFNIMLMMAAVLSSILIHLILDNFPQVSHWNLIFWKACVQMGISLPFMLQKRRDISLSFGQKIAPKLSVRKTMLDPFLMDTYSPSSCSILNIQFSIFILL